MAQTRSVSVRQALKAAHRGQPKWAKVLTIRRSRIHGAGLGLFAAQRLPKGYWLPERYKGRYLTEAQCARIRDSAYVFKLSRGNLRECAAIDAKKQLADNPLRYVNGARTPGQCQRVNLKAKQRGRNIYYYTTRQVHAGEELLLDYGPEYWFGVRFQLRTRELNKELRILRKALAAAPERSPKRKDLEEQIARVHYSKDQLEDMDDSDADSD
eukprot:CAMPEP_0171072858 /NCGR_PEP_ID=MMETSP0766_2-20121228/11140_1 /TAXON_ID=439317 /ORGANISM="Gambierdiscus australes, Strain CAWD 149" /LENGTH=211 /DNA_ID=CAMNT_0011529493 /DNA_START=36 /DNA_END=671 /DNA_ORIENTATION=-